jgi:hypothetical protein
MLNLDDVRWTEMTGGYRMLLDPRPMLSRLETEPDTSDVWKSLWDELHHQGDVGEASFTAIPYIVRAYRQRAAVEWNTFAIVAIIELARNQGSNPDVPEWLAEDYYGAIRELAELGARDVFRTDRPEETESILSVIAIQRGLRTLGKFLVNYSEAEMLEFEPSS